jgi:hypothetical protein
MDELGRLRQAHQEAEDALRSLEAETHVIDADHMERYGVAAVAEEASRTAYLDRWRELFE